jgi:hypothetical protein
MVHRFEGGSTRRAGVRRAIQSPKRGVGPASAALVVTRARKPAREKHRGDPKRPAVRSTGSTVRGQSKRGAGSKPSARGWSPSVVRFARGRSVGTWCSRPGCSMAGLWGTSSAGATSHPAPRPDGTERVLKDLRSLCRAAQAFDEKHGRPASLRDFLGHAAAACPGARRRRDPSGRRLHDSQSQGNRGDAGDSAGLRGAVASRIAIAGLARTPRGCARNGGSSTSPSPVPRTGCPDTCPDPCGGDTAGPSRFLYEAGLLSHAPRDAG